MRVLFICPTHFSAKSVLAGAERYSFELAKAMARRTPTTLITFGDEAFESYDGALRIRCYRRWLYVKNNRMNPFNPSFLKEVVAADVVHCLQFATVASDLAIAAGALATYGVMSSKVLDSKAPPPPKPTGDGEAKP